MSLEESRLYQDLYLDHRDAMYRALSFIEQHGGPAAPDDTREALVAARGGATAWLSAHPDIEALLNAYEPFLSSWSPVFQE